MGKEGLGILAIAGLSGVQILLLLYRCPQTTDVEAFGISATVECLADHTLPLIRDCAQRMNRPLCLE